MIRSIHPGSQFFRRRLLSLVPLVPIVAVAAACGGETPAAEAPPHRNQPLTNALKDAVKPAAAEGDAGAGSRPYSGHGASSVPKEVIAKFAPPPLPEDLSRTFQSMLDVRAPSAGRLSPNGKTLFMTWNVTGTSQIWRVDGAQHFPVQMTGGEDQTTLADVAPDGSFLVLQRDRKGEENPGIYLQDPKGGKLTVVAHKPGVQSTFQFLSDDGKYIYYRSNDVKPGSYILYRYDRAKNTREVVFDQEGIWGIADYRPAAPNSPELKLLLQKEVGGDMNEYYEWDTSKKTLTPLFGQGEKEDYEAQYGAKDGEILAQTSHLSEFKRLYRWDLAQKKFTPIVAEIPHEIFKFQVDHSRTRIAYAINDQGYTRLKIIDARTYKDITPPAIAKLTGDHVTFGSMTRDGRYLSVTVDSGKAPPTSYIYDWKTGSLTAWHTPSSPEVDGATFAPAKLESYPARDGTAIPMFVRRPEPSRCAAHPCPVLVMFHGGPEGQAPPGFSPVKQAFVDAGFILVEPNVRGSSGYGKTWLHADDGPKRLNIITDIEDVSKYIRANWGEGGKAPKIGVWGGSYGGYSTLIAMTMFAGAYDAGSSNVGISNLMTFLQNTAPYRRILRISEYGDPERDKDALIKLSPSTHIDKLSAPLQIIQGASDPRVPVGESLQMYDLLQKKNVPSQLIIFADEGHGAQKRDNRVLQFGHVLRFFKENLLGTNK
ncbi:prolyl oligopeptidase family serine peptidase [Pendulispora brunnea]|uniref:Prolyl oligopeptidase family serine peptidase n=1 Tax=Pendulispora brunnea TaxID=2905690 RepID=A0ABZ2K6E8_9BACT